MKKPKYAAAALFYMSAVPLGAKSHQEEKSDHTFLYSEDRKIDQLDIAEPDINIKATLQDSSK